MPNLRSTQSEKNWITAPGYVRIHLVIRGAHVGYMNMSFRDWDNFLWGHPRSPILETNPEGETGVSTVTNQIVPD